MFRNGLLERDVTWLALVGAIQVGVCVVGGGREPVLYSNGWCISRRKDVVNVSV